MSRNPSCTVYIGNLDEKVTERVLYEILIQVGRLVDLHIPCDKETNRPRGYAFAEYESEEIANYAVRLFSGIVRLNNKTLKFGMSGQDKPSANSATLATPATPNQNLIPVLPSQQSVQSLASCRFSAQTHSAHSNYSPASPHGSGSIGSVPSSFDYSRRTFGQTMNTIHVQNSRY